MTAPPKPKQANNFSGAGYCAQPLWCYDTMVLQHLCTVQDGVDNSPKVPDAEVPIIIKLNAISFTPNKTAPAAYGRYIRVLS